MYLFHETLQKQQVYVSVTLEHTQYLQASVNRVDKLYSTLCHL